VGASTRPQRRQRAAAAQPSKQRCSRPPAWLLGGLLCWGQPPGSQQQRKEDGAAASYDKVFLFLRRRNCALGSPNDAKREAMYAHAVWYAQLGWHQNNDDIMPTTLKIGHGMTITTSDTPLASYTTSVLQSKGVFGSLYTSRQPALASHGNAATSPSTKALGSPTRLIHPPHLVALLPAPPNHLHPQVSPPSRSRRSPSDGRSC
jgi:hypothetical protein